MRAGVVATRASVAPRPCQRMTPACLPASECYLPGCTHQFMSLRSSRHHTIAADLGSSDTGRSVTDREYVRGLSVCAWGMKRRRNADLQAAM